MKTIYLLPLLLLMACKTHFKKGDCVQYSPSGCEKWQKKCEIWTAKILELGNKNYHVLMYYSDNPRSYFEQTVSFTQVDHLFNKTECWEDFASAEGDVVYGEKK